MKIKSRVIDLTPEVATALLGQNTSNRNISPIWVTFLAKTITRGEWQLNGQPLVVSDKGDLLDGQHRCLAVIKAGVAIQVLLVEGAAADSFATMDHNKSRSYANVLEARGLRKGAKWLAAAAREALLWERQEWSRSGPLNVTTGELDETVARHPDIAHWAQEARRQRDRVPYSRVGIVTVLHDVAHAFDDDLAEEFFDGVWAGANLSAGDPRLALRNRLFREQSSTTTHPKVPDVRFWWVRSWDLFAGGESLLKLSRRSARVPLPRGYEEWIEADA